MQLKYKLIIELQAVIAKMRASGEPCWISIITLEAAKDPCGPKLLVRAEKSRLRKVEQESLWQFMSGKEIAGTLKVRIPRSKERKAREAIIDIRFSEVSLMPPKDTDYPPIKVWAVYAFESEPEDGQTQIYYY